MKVKDLNDYTIEDLKAIKDEALTEAHSACMALAGKYGNDFGCCGFAWLNIYGIKGNTRLGKKMKAVGFDKSWLKGAIYLWSPGNYNGQSLDIHEAGARAAAKIFTGYGFKAYSGSRMD